MNVKDFKYAVMLEDDMFALCDDEVHAKTLTRLLKEDMSDEDRFNISVQEVWFTEQVIIDVEP